MVITEDRGEVRRAKLSAKASRSLQVVKTFRERIEPAQVICEGAVRPSGWEVTRHGPAAGESERCRRHAREKMWDIPICEATASRWNSQALKNGAFGQRGFVDEVELKLPEMLRVRPGVPGPSGFESRFFLDLLKNWNKRAT